MKAVAGRQPRAPSKSGCLTEAEKLLTTLLVGTLRGAVEATGQLPYVEPVLRFAIHVPIYKGLELGREKTRGR